MLTLSSYALTHTGRVRESNEDAVLVTDRLVAVADGMGGHAAGEVASNLAIERMAALGTDSLRAEDVTEAVLDADRIIREAGAAEPGHAGMGTTLCGVALVDAEPNRPGALVFNVGDSRVYRLTDDTFTQISIDHSEVQELRDAGRLDALTARTYARRNVITRALGGMSAVVPDAWLMDPAGRFLVCSDGLSGELDDDAIAELLVAHSDPEAAARALLDHALDAGGHDNISVIVADVAEVAAAPAPVAIAGAHQV